MILAFWCLFFLTWGTGRRGVMRNLKSIKPGSTAIVNFFRCYRVFWNFAWAMADSVCFKERGIMPDFEFVGWQHFEAMQRNGGAILLTAHMGSYDLGAQLFAENSSQRIIMVRAPEVDPQTREFEEARLSDKVQTEFNIKATDLALDLLHAGVEALQAVDARRHRRDSRRSRHAGAERLAGDLVRQGNAVTCRTVRPWDDSARTDLPDLHRAPRAETLSFSRLRADQHRSNARS